MKMEFSKTGFLYVRKSSKTQVSQKGRGFPIGCIAYGFAGDGKFHFSYSIYNHNDKFSKAEARKVASDRLNSGESGLIFFTEGVTPKHEILYQVLASLAFGVCVGKIHLTKQFRKACREAAIKLETGTNVPHPVERNVTVDKALQLLSESFKSGLEEVPIKEEQKTQIVSYLSKAFGVLLE